jgi:hypothetical protein
MMVRHGGILRSGAGYQQLVEAVWDASEDTLAGVRAVFEGAALVLEATDYVEACPIATVALEVASTNEPLRLVTAQVFEAWTRAASERLASAGLERSVARRLALVVITSLEGAFVLCQATKSLEPMEAAGQAAADAIAHALGERARPQTIH